MSCAAVHMSSDPSRLKSIKNEALSENGSAHIKKARIQKYRALQLSKFLFGLNGVTIRIWWLLHDQILFTFLRQLGPTQPGPRRIELYRNPLFDCLQRRSLRLLWQSPRVLSDPEWFDRQSNHTGYCLYNRMSLFLLESKNTLD